MYKDSSMSPASNETNTFEDEDNSVASSTTLEQEAEKDGFHKPAVLFVPRIGAIAFFLLAGAGIAAGMHVYLQGESEEIFESQMTTFADQISASVDESFTHIHGLLTALSTSLTATSLIGNSTALPYHKSDTFVATGQSFLEEATVPLVSWSPIVQGTAELNAWEEYSKLAVHPTGGTGTYAPIWQTVTNQEDSSSTNYNLYAQPKIRQSLEVVSDTGLHSLSGSVDTTSLYGRYKSSETNRLESLLMVPLLSNFSRTSQAVTGIVIAVVPWDTFFQGIFHDAIHKVDVVMSDGICGNSMTMTIEGPEVILRGLGDRHDTRYTHLAEMRDFVPDLTQSDCKLSLTVYPTQEIVQEDESSFPPYVPILIVTVVFSIIFVIYDVVLRRREEKVMGEAKKTNDILSALFPAGVHNRLFGKGNNDKIEEVEEEEAITAKQTPESSKYRLKSYLANEDQKTKANANINTPLGTSAQESVPGADMYGTKPIADLFPNTTIMFADIAGFTAWSSVREPSQVFTLLETVYSAFDAIAKKRKVFKVETVGDCYVAVTGLPEPRADHAFAMAKFARECVMRFNELSKQLEVKLGPDTGDLAMRAGLHSGPVTAGVLRGDKSRFQLFGDTVNQAARIEGTGKRNRVHLSSETAELLIKAGKKSWIKKREDVVTAKGKGEIHTYWLHSPQDAIAEASQSKITGPPRLSIQSNNSSNLDNMALAALEQSLPPKILRLVRWNVEILKKLLQQVIAQRQGQNAAPKRKNQNLDKRESQLSKQKQCLEEVTEIIALPSYDHKDYVDPRKVEIPPEVVKELQHFVCVIASLHRDNRFHNFEHASHVTMSVSKLLNRIVAPDHEVINQQSGNDLALSLHDHTYGITSDPLTQFSIVLAALIHDVDHSGVSNFQLIKEKTPMAAFFKQKSVAEQNSIVLAWDQLMLPKYSLLRRTIYTDQIELDRFRQILINNVLATDIFDKELQGLRKSRWENAFHMKGMQSVDKSPLDDSNRKATIVMEHLIQASDVSHTMQHWHVYQKWNERLFAEMMEAYQSGRMDKDPSLNWYQGELGFFDNYIIPLARKLEECGVFGVSSDEYLNYALENRREWSKKGEDVVDKMMATYCPDRSKRESVSGEVL
ncbi:unnamed protein product [Cylindrotheca closterium]|uniref:Guanylate cyclase domain-containing protein n=1 Tax=Cylindrotheca closterium TaxID=2856 RepID=A0AAD2G6M3_9STRA|nr:unnamed protein product [Cylindrotheca closterium]